MLPDLIKNGVTCDLRKLHVGDLLWVAREKTPQTETGKGKLLQSNLYFSNLVGLRKKIKILKGIEINKGK